MSVVYLLHFNECYPNGRKPQHYMGVAVDLAKRIREHENGSSKGALTRALRKVGIGFQVAQTWSFGTPDEAFAFEKQAKRQKQHSRFCPVCRESCQ